MLESGVIAIKRYRIRQTSKIGGSAKCCVYFLWGFVEIRTITAEIAERVKGE